MSNDDLELARFVENLHQEVIIDAEGNQTEEEGSSFREEAFTRIMIEYLTEAGELEDGHVCYHSARGIKVNGYNLQEEEGRLDLFISIYIQNPSPTTVRKDTVESAFKQLINFLSKVYKGYHQSIEEASPSFDMAQLIYSQRSQLSHVRLFLFTDGLTTLQTKKSQEVNGVNYSYNIWDLRRTYRCITSGQQREAIKINFLNQYNFIIPCLAMPESQADYRAYVAIIPGEILCKIYAEYGSRLLERNVRSFLQAKGNVNKGIRQTILKEPHRFLAYNNGISATAETVKLVDLHNGGQGIVEICDLQIVNGGQTTASLYQAVRKDKADISGIYVQTKLTVVDRDRMDEIVPLISRYANNQNKVSEADFSANDPFHIRVEELSRTIWAPTVNGTQRQTRWFYERARGQYADAKNRESTPAKQKAFTLTHPNAQKFTKTDLAKFEHTWDQLPHIVSLGAQKNFAKFTVGLTEKRRPEPDETYFTHLIAKAILFKTAEKIVQSEKFGGYRANIVTYTLAYLSYKAQQKVDLDKIWKQQSLTPSLQQAIHMISREVHQVITHPPDGRNVTEWCKKESCWKAIQGIPTEIFEVSCLAP
ncbi:AIPR family protein [Candidatus Chloroploca sp. Khr17]|uniref:AIPR family protein n=1 Tax=Candidatus Chloroploca sp. Khr17 TaxID=2496869 RepID=UPI00101C77F6|nr:AIPR family protein [Candidatus Chloroploca sp. Khr17]